MDRVIGVRVVDRIDFDEAVREGVTGTDDDTDVVAAVVELFAIKDSLATTSVDVGCNGNGSTLEVINGCCSC
jgi:hypothetical protein